MKLRSKFILSVMTIIFIFVITLNIAIRYILISRMETSIKNSSNQLMYSTREAIKYKVIAVNELRKEDFTKNIKAEGKNLLDYILTNFKCNAEIRDNDGKVICSNIDETFNLVLKNGTDSAMKGAAVVNLKYSSNKLYAVLSYPLYINDEKTGILNIVRDYSSVHNENERVIFIITMVEVVIFIFIIIISYIIISKVTRPIVTLTDCAKNIGQGQYNFKFDIKGKDEVAILSHEFMNMEEKIKQQIRTIEEEKEKVQRLEKSRKAFFDNVTHEMKTPLTAISGYAEMIKDDMVDDEKFKKRAIERIYLESERLHKLILNLIEVSRGLAYTKEAVKVISVKPLIDQVIEDMKIKSNKYGIKIESSIDTGYIMGEENRITQLMINIIDNDIKYSRKNSVVSVKGILNENDYVILTQSQSGYIDEEVYNHIFEPFIKSNKVADAESRGLGLYLCKEIVKDHGGTIEVINGEVVTYRITIPRVKD